VRFVRPSLLVFTVAVLASLSIHLPVYTALGGLADVLIHGTKPKAKYEPVEFELTDTPAPAAETEAEPMPEPEKQAEAKPPEKPEKTRPQDKQLAQKPAAAKPRAPTPPPVPVEVVPTPVPPRVDKDLSKHAITQKSEDPNVPPPDNARFIAEESRRVEEETVATVRTTAELDETPTTQSRARSADDAMGNADEDDVQEMQEVRGEDTRNPTAKEAREKPDAPSQPSKGDERDPAVARAPTQGGSPEPEQESQPAVEAGSERTGGEPDTLVLNDGAGSIRIRRAPPGQGSGDRGGDSRPGSPGGAQERAGARAGAGTNLKLSFSQFEATFGSEELKKQREAFLEQQKTRARGGRSEEQWRKFRAAIENYVDKVKPGNQTALNAAASPFAAYLAAVHRNIHREFALGFLRGLPLVGGPFADPNLRTRLALVINQDGSLHQVGVIQTSGFTPYDFGAWNAVMKAAPFPEAPKKILSGDGRVYVHWDFYNNERQCGTFNAEPYILPMPERKAPPAPGPMQDTGGDTKEKKFGWWREDLDVDGVHGHGHVDDQERGVGGLALRRVALP